jgi:pyruvate,water dikinase
VTGVSHQASDAAFPIEWEDPADADVCWRYDAEHTPGAYAPLEFELGMGPFLNGFGWGLQPRHINFFIYDRVAPPPSDGASHAPPPKPNADGVREGGRRWREEVLPEVIEHTTRYRTTDFASMTNEQLIDELERLPAMRHRSGQLHTLAITPHWLGMTLVVDTYKELTGGSDLEALRLMQGYGHKSFEAGEQLWQVSRIAKDTPSVAERLASIDNGTAVATLDALRSEPAAGPFVAAFDAYLDDYGWRTGGGFRQRTWFEDPTTPLIMLRAYLETEGYDPAAEQHRLAEEREVARNVAMSGLDAAGQRRLQEALDAAHEVVMLSEDHNFYIDQRLWCMPRRLIMAAGERLVAADALEDASDVFFLRSRELCAGLAGSGDGLSDVAAKRKADFDRWKDVRPPTFVGAAPPPGLAEHRPRAPREPGGELRGTAASAGVARGPARVILSLSEAGRLRPGDIMVTRVTSPPWTPLFAVAAAVVTEVGGVLSHTAIAAREYGIPAIAGLSDATRRLRDGQLVEVDGSTGEVRVVV